MEQGLLTADCAAAEVRQEAQDGGDNIYIRRCVEISDVLQNLSQ